jgi:hypothetical protein
VGKWVICIQTECLLSKLCTQLLLKLHAKFLKELVFVFINGIHLYKIISVAKEQTNYLVLQIFYLRTFKISRMYFTQNQIYIIQSRKYLIMSVTLIQGNIRVKMKIVFILQDYSI